MKFLNKLTSFQKLGITTVLIIVGYVLIGLLNQAHADELLRTQAINPVYKILTTTPEGPGSCSATAIKIKGVPDDANVFLTAKHCINPEHPIGKLIEEEITDKSEWTRYYDYKVVMISPSSDLAGIRVDDPSLKTQKAVVADTQGAVEGDQVFSVGYPLGESRVVSTGFLGQKERSFHPLGDIKVMQRASTLLDKGMSGGPLYQKTDKGYEIIGVASLKANSNDFMSSFVTLTDIKNFVERGE